jgi:hypothetical protein
MESMWNRAEVLANRHESAGGHWLRLTGDGDRAIVCFRGDPYPREVVFVDGGYQPFGGEHAKQGLKPSLRVAINVVVLPSREVKVFELGAGLFRDLVKVRNKYGLDGWTFEVQRHGGPKDPKTTYTLLPEKQLTDEEQQLFPRLKLHDLEALYEGRHGVVGATPSASKTIDDADAQALVATLKALPRDAAERFCRELGVQRIKDVPASQLDRARSLVAALAGSSLANGIDPFGD